MNRFDRITALLIQLQAKRMVKGPELAARYGVSLRTIYRDLRTLEEAGVPLCGEAGVGYSLAEGYRLPPVMFSREEATALLTAEKLASQLTDTHTAQLSAGAMDKLRAVLRRTDRDFLEDLSPRITILHPDRYRTPPHPPVTNVHQRLLTAIADKRVVSLDYRAGYEATPSQREIEPIAVYLGQYWHVVAFCRLRQEFRDFRLDRIVGLHLREEHFPPRPDTLQTYWQQLAARRQTQAAVVRFTPAALPHVQETKYHFGAAQEHTTPTGELEITFLTGEPENLARWLLLFAGQATIVSPPTLLAQVRELARLACEGFGA